MLTKEEIERRIDAASKTPTEATCCMDLVKLACEAADEIERLRLQVRNSLANNLCPDHRDKQKGKPCLACEIERLRADRSTMLHYFKLTEFRLLRLMENAIERGRADLFDQEQIAWHEEHCRRRPPKLKEEYEQHCREVLG